MTILATEVKGNNTSRLIPKLQEQQMKKSKPRQGLSKKAITKGRKAS